MPPMDSDAWEIANYDLIYGRCANIGMRTGYMVMREGDVYFECVYLGKWSRYATEVYRRIEARERTALTDKAMKKLESL